MNKEQTELLFKDLCGRLPYGVKFPTKKYCGATHDFIDVVRTIQSINSNGTCRTEEDDVDFPFAWSIRPYLFPYSSLTEEQIKEVHELSTLRVFPNVYLINWFLENHVDIYGFIEMGLANDATGLNIY